MNSKVKLLIFIYFSKLAKDFLITTQCFMYLPSSGVLILILFEYRDSVEIRPADKRKCMKHCVALVVSKSSAKIKKINIVLNHVAYSVNDNIV